MNRTLRERRDAAATRHDAALARFPSREGPTFQAELKSVMEELSTIASEADVRSSDAVELAKTQRWLGDACFDLGRGTDDALLARGAQAYARADELLASAEAPIEKAKLDFKYANTLRGLSRGVDVGLLEAAETRYESAARTFRTHHLEPLAETVKAQRRALDPQLRLARKHATLRRQRDELEDLARRAGRGGPGRA